MYGNADLDYIRLHVWADSCVEGSSYRIVHTYELHVATKFVLPSVLHVWEGHDARLHDCCICHKCAEYLDERASSRRQVSVSENLAVDAALDLTWPLFYTDHSRSIVCPGVQPNVQRFFLHSRCVVIALTASWLLHALHLWFRFVGVTDRVIVRYFATYLYITKDNSLVGQSCHEDYRTNGVVCFGVYDMKCLYRRSVNFWCVCFT